MVALEGAGIASVMVASAEFVEAAQTQSDALGADPRRVFVEHPIQDRTDDEMRAIAEAAAEEVLQAITATSLRPKVGDVDDVAETLAAAEGERFR